MELHGAVIVVTGGASGLGAATAERLASDGAKILVLDLQEDLGKALAESIDGAFVSADVTSEEDVRSAVEVASEMGPVRGLVNCAGIGSSARTVDRNGTPHELSPFQKVVSINLIGTFNCIRLLASVIARQDPLDAVGGRGAIVNTASVAAFDGQIGQAAYSASKGGIVGMTLPVARDLSSVGIRVNTVAPGIIDTPLLASLPEPARESLAYQVLFPKRLGRPDEFAELARFLLVHDYMNGEVVRMDGGIRMAPK